MLMHLGFSELEPCLAVRVRSGQGCTSPCARRRQIRQSLAHTCAGFRGLNDVLWSPVVTCRFLYRTSMLDSLIPGRVRKQFAYYLEDEKSFLAKRKIIVSRLRKAIGKL